MKAPLLALAVALAACATSKPPPLETGARDQRLDQMRQQGREIAGREQRCIDETTQRAADRIATAAAAPDAFAELEIQADGNQRDREVARCRAQAERENDALASSERNDYEVQARQEQDRAALMMILTTSHPH